MYSSDQKLEELYAKFCTRLESEWKNFMKETSEEFAKLKQAKQRLEEEQKILAKVVKDADEILNLNISGEKIMVKRSVLTMVQGSVLEVMISNDHKLQRDKEKNIYLDFNPVCFKKIVDFMKLKSIETDNKPPPMPVIDQSIKEEFEYLANYLGVLILFQTAKKIEEAPPVGNDCFELKDQNVEFSENGKVCTSLNDSHKWVIGKNGYSQGVYAFEFEILKLLNNNWMFLGILDSTPERNYNDHYSYAWKGCYGWAGCGGQVSIDGANNQGKDGYNEKNDFLENDTIILTLNLEQNTLTFENKRNGKKYVLGIPLNKIWKIHVNIYGNGDKIRFAKQSKIK